jgi:hypothetical protein
MVANGPLVKQVYGDLLEQGSTGLPQGETVT